jgi:hypothetical protein
MEPTLHKKKTEREEKKKKRVQNFFLFNAEFMRIHKKEVRVRILCTTRQE